MIIKFLTLFPSHSGRSIAQLKDAELYADSLLINDDEYKTGRMVNWKQQKKKRI